jgi:glucose-1-phosphate thymidylyltransferase
LGDNIFEADLAPIASAYAKQAKGARICVKPVPDPQRYGVATISGDKIVRVVEKPKQPESDMAVTGIYFYDAEVFRIIKTLKPSGRNELEITDVNNAYIEAGTMQFGTLEGFWTDAGTFDSWKLANDLVLGR